MSSRLAWNLDRAGTKKVGGSFCLVEKCPKLAVELVLGSGKAALVNYYLLLGVEDAHLGH